MKPIFILIILGFIINTTNAQERYITKQGRISFFSHSPVEDIEAFNNQTLSIVDIKTGEIAISVLMKSFMFEKSLMQEHFNENYIESDKFPKALFTGKILDIKNLKNTNDVIIEGVLTIHGVSKNVTVKSQIEVDESNIVIRGVFNVLVSDYQIKIPSVVRNNIAETIEITFSLNHKKFN
jgi:polyisoprenoid-binding protein YceI